MSLSGGQQQRLCIARALAVRPQVLLMDEPCSALDPISTRVVEETIGELAHDITIVIVTHNMQQAARVSDQCAFFLVEELRRAGPDRRGRRDRRRCSSRRTTRARSTTSPAGSDDAVARCAPRLARSRSSCSSLVVGRRRGPGSRPGAASRDHRRRVVVRRARDRPVAGRHRAQAVLPQVNYVSQGSTFGRQEFIDGNLDYGASDITFQPTEIPPAPGQALRRAARRAGCFVYVPVSAGGLAFMYNLDRRVGQPRQQSQAHPARRRARSSPARSASGTTPRSSRPTRSSRASTATSCRSSAPTARARASCSRSSASRSRQDVWDAFVAERIRNDPANVAHDFRAGHPVSNWPQNWGRSLAGALRRRHRERRRRRSDRARTRSPTSPPGTPRSGASRSRRCRTRPGCSPNPTRTTSRSRSATPPVAATARST